MDFSIPEDLEALLSSFRSFLDREVRPVEERFRPEFERDYRSPEMREAVVGEVGFGFQSAMKVLNAGRAYIGASCVGIADYLVRIWQILRGDGVAHRRPGRTHLPLGRMLRIVEGTSEIPHLIIARSLGLQERDGRC